MTAQPPAQRRLRRELTLRLMSPLLAIVVATAALGTWSAQRLTDSVFDRWLFDAAQSVATLVRFEQGQARLDLPPEAERLLLYDEVDRSYFSVSQGERLLAGSRALPEHGAHERRTAQGRVFQSEVAGAAVRVVALTRDDGAGHAVSVKVAETLEKRHRLRGELALLLLPMALLVLAAAAAIVLAVRHTIRPLEAIAARWNQQSQASLAPIADDDVPRELAPFAQALNGLLARVSAMLEHERQFAATAAHQLRTPLAGLQLGLARAAEAPDLASTRAILGELAHSAQRPARLVQQLLTAGRLGMAGGGPLPLQPTDLVALAQDVGAAHVDEAVARRLALEFDPHVPALVVPAHAELLSEALGNLLDNALRYTPAGGRVLIEVDDRPPRVSVSDSGPGIREDERAAVLERFRRGRDASGDGSGLGLAIVRDIAALNGASLELHDAAGGGLRARIVFPEGRSSA
jgi:two-component system sensor histidine kinase TctE